MKNRSKVYLSNEKEYEYVTEDDEGKSSYLIAWLIMQINNNHIIWEKDNVRDWWRYL